MWNWLYMSDAVLAFSLLCSIGMAIYFYCWLNGKCKKWRKHWPLIVMIGNLYLLTFPTEASKSNSLSSILDGFLEKFTFMKTLNFQTRRVLLYLIVIMVLFCANLILKIIQDGRKANEQDGRKANESVPLKEMALFTLLLSAVFSLRNFNGIQNLQWGNFIEVIEFLLYIAAYAVIIFAMVFILYVAAQKIIPDVKTLYSILGMGCTLAAFIMTYIPFKDKMKDLNSETEVFKIILDNTYIKSFLFLMVLLVCSFIGTMIFIRLIQTLAEICRRIQKQTGSESSVKKIVDAITEFITEIIRTITEIFNSVAKFIGIIPNFMNEVRELLLPDANNGKTSVALYAAFCLAVVSFLSTSEGLTGYVFEANRRLEAYCISFAVQILLLFLSVNWKNLWKNGGTISVRGRLICGYVALLILSSSFSFVHICNQSFYKHKAGYIDRDVRFTEDYNAAYSTIYPVLLDGTNTVRFKARDHVTKLSRLAGAAAEPSVDVGTKSNIVTVSAEAVVGYIEGHLEQLLNREDGSYAENRFAQDLKKVSYQELQEIQSFILNREDRISAQISENALTIREQENVINKNYDIRYTNPGSEAIKTAEERREQVERENITLERQKTYLTTLKAKCQEENRKDIALTNRLLEELLKDQWEPSTIRGYLTDLTEEIIVYNRDEGVLSDETFDALSGTINALLEEVSAYETAEEAIEKLNAVQLPQYSAAGIDDALASAWEQSWRESFDGLEKGRKALLSLRKDESGEDESGEDESEKLKEQEEIEKQFKEIYADRRLLSGDMNAVEKALRVFKMNVFTAAFSAALALSIDLFALYAGFLNSEDDKGKNGDDGGE